MCVICCTHETKTQYFGFDIIVPNVSVLWAGLPCRVLDETKTGKTPYHIKGVIAKMDNLYYNLLTSEVIVVGINTRD